MLHVKEIHTQHTGLLHAHLAALLDGKMCSWQGPVRVGGAASRTNVGLNHELFTAKPKCFLSSSQAWLHVLCRIRRVGLQENHVFHAIRVGETVLGTNGINKLIFTLCLLPHCFSYFASVSIICPPPLCLQRHFRHKSESVWKVSLLLNMIHNSTTVTWEIWVTAYLTATRILYFALTLWHKNTVDLVSNSQHPFCTFTEFRKKNEICCKCINTRLITCCWYSSANGGRNALIETVWTNET